MWAGLGYVHDAGGDRVQIDISTCCQKRFFIEDSDALEAFLEERPGMMPLKSQLAELSPFG
jgi:hypothetical protein